MGKRRTAAELRRDAEFAAFAAGAGGRLLHAATLLTGDREAADRLLTATLAQVYADWLRMRAEDPYEQARRELVRRFAHRPWWRRPHGGTLDRLTGQERLVVTMRFFEGIAEEQTAAQLGLPAERVRAIGARATATLRSRRDDPGGLLAGSPPPGARSRASATAGAGSRPAGAGDGMPGSGRAPVPTPADGEAPPAARAAGAGGLPAQEIAP